MKRDHLLISRHIIHPVSVIEKMDLDCRTPFGLFETDNGNRFIISDDFEGRIAIVVEHPKLPAFTWLALGNKALDRGWWRGPFRVQLMSAWHGNPGKPKMGLLGFTGDCPALYCRGEDGEKQWVALGYAGAAPNDDAFPDFDGWSIEAVDAKQPFFSRHPSVPRRKDR